MAFNLIMGGGFALFGALLGYFVRQSIARGRATGLEKKAEADLLSARTEAQETLLKAKDSALAVMQHAREEERERKEHLNRFEERLMKAQEGLDRELKEIAVAVSKWAY